MIDRTPPLPSPSFTPRERDVLRLMQSGLSNAEIAEQLVFSAETVRWYVKAIYSKLGVHSRDEALTLLDELAEQQLEPAESPNPYRLPAPVTSLVGRAREIAALRALLKSSAIRLMTLLGAPGIGKTRLSIETAHRMVNEFTDGVVFVPLAPLTDPALVPDALLSALGLDAGGGNSPAERLKVFLRGRSLLLVLDNFEHLLSAAPLAGDLLSAAPGLKILATSREPLRVYGEHEFAVPPLDPAEEGVTLFEVRAQAVRPDFKVGEHNAATVTTICRRLDGLPLAIELAAARMKLHSPHMLLGRLAGRLNILTSGARDLPARQQTLRAAIAWSYDLLTPDEQRLFARFAVFDGGAPLEAFAEVCGFGLTTDPLDGLESLVSKNLIQQATSEDGEPRFTMYESLIEFATEQLAESGEDEAARIAHARYYLRLARQIALALHTSDEAQAVRQFPMEYPNLRTAWLFAASRKDDELLELASENFLRVFYTIASVHDGVALYETALETRRDQNTLVEADLLAGVALLSGQQTEAITEDHEAFARTALAIYDQLGRPERKGYALSVVASCHLDRGERESAEVVLDQLRNLGRTYDRPHLADHAELVFALLVGKESFSQAYHMLEEMLLERRRKGGPGREAVILANLIYFAFGLGELNRAEAWARELLDCITTRASQAYLSVAYDWLSLLAFLNRDYDEARNLSFQAKQLAFELGHDALVATSNALLAMVEAVQSQLDRARDHLKNSLAQVELIGPDSRIIVLAAAPYVALYAGQHDLAVVITAWVTSQAQHVADVAARLAPLLTELEAALTPEAYAAAWARGEAMTVEEALELARQVAASE